MSFHDDREIGWVNPNTGVTYLRDVRYRCAMDNYEPPRREEVGALQEWRQPDGSLHSYSLTGWGHVRDAEVAVYLIDDGRTVAPHYVAGYSDTHDRLTLMPFPVNVNADGTPRLRSDRPEPVNYSLWMLGPRRMFHLKIQADEIRENDPTCRASDPDYCDGTCKN